MSINDLQVLFSMLFQKVFFNPPEDKVVTILYVRV